ncbi:MAG: hypothetical protein ACLQOO_24405 [Terriglobia bacterium]
MRDLRALLYRRVASLPAYEATATLEGPADELEDLTALYVARRRLTFLRSFGINSTSCNMWRTKIFVNGLQASPKSCFGSTSGSRVIGGKGPEVRAPRLGPLEMAARVYTYSSRLEVFSSLCHHFAVADSALPATPSDPLRAMRNILRIGPKVVTQGSTTQRSCETDAQYIAHRSEG